MQLDGIVVSVAAFGIADCGHADDKWEQDTHGQGILN